MRQSIGEDLIMTSNAIKTTEWAIRDCAAVVFQKGNLRVSPLVEMLEKKMPETYSEEERQDFITQAKEYTKRKIINLVNKDSHLVEVDIPVWAIYDAESEKILFTHKNQFRGSPIYKKNHHFMSPPGKLFRKCRYGTAYLKARTRKFEQFENKKLLKLDDIMMSDPEYWNSFKGKDVMVVGAGPSAKDIKWENISYDSLWTCNEFYHFDKLKDMRIDLACMASELQLYKNDIFEKELARNPDMKVAVEIERGSFRYDEEQLTGFLKDHPDRGLFFHGRYRGAIGMTARMVILAILSGAKNVYVVGLDGRARDETDETVLNVFNNKKKLPNWFKNLEDSWQIQLAQFFIFWEHIADIALENDCSVYNLGQGHVANVSSGITEALLPWGEDISDVLKDEE